MMTVPRALLILLAVVSWAPSSAQSQTTVGASTLLRQVEADLTSVERTFDGQVDADSRSTLRAKTAQANARTATGQLEEELARIDARRQGLGAAAPNAAETVEIRREREQLQRQHDALDAIVKRARLAGVEGQQLIDEINRSQAEQLNRTLATHAPSPLTPAFWRAVFVSAPRDLRRIDLFASQGVAAVRRELRQVRSSARSSCCSSDWPSSAPSWVCSIAAT